MTMQTEKYYPFNAVEWITQNMHRNYPIVDDCIVQSRAGAYLPSSFIADISLHILPGAASRANFYISSVINTGGVISVDVSYRVNGDSGDFVCARAVGIPSSLQAGDTIASRTFTLLASTDTIPDKYQSLRLLSGTIIIGTCADLGVDSYLLNYDSSRILDTCITQSLAGMYSVTAISSSGETATFSTDFTLQAGDGIELDVRNELNTATGLYEPTLIIYRVATDAEKSAVYKTVDQVVKAVTDELGIPIKTINGVMPDSYGNIEITGDDCTEVTTGVSSVNISNKCAKPCCSDTSSSDINMALQSLEASKDRLLEYFNTLTNNINTMQARLASLIVADNS